MRRATQPLTFVAEAITGASVERQVAEYSETFTQVVLGLHEDLTAESRRIGQLEVDVSRLEGRVSNAQSQRYSRPVIIAALVVGLVALGVALWAAL